MTASLFGKVGLQVAKGIFTSPMGLCLISVILIITIGWNPLILGFDLVIKSMNIFSGNALVQQIIDGTFDVESPVFVIYITIFIVSFILLLFKIIKSLLSDVTFGGAEMRASRQNNKKSTSLSKFKWVLIWLLTWLLLPFCFGLVMYLINLFASLFSLMPLSINNFYTFTIEDWDSSLNLIMNSLLSSKTSISDIINVYFPEDISNVTVVPPEMIKQGMTLEAWKEFLTKLSTNQDALNFKSNLLLLNQKIDVAISSKIFEINSSKILNYTNKQTAELINELIENINSVGNFIRDKKIPISSLEIAFSQISNELQFSDQISVQFLTYIKNIDISINEIATNINNAYYSSSLEGIAYNGIQGQVSVTNDLTWELEKITKELGYALYLVPINSSYMTVGNINNNLNGPLGGIGTLITNIANFFSVIFDPLTITEIFISTLGFAMCFTTFWSLLLIFSSRTFEFFACICTGPFVSTSGINDNGEKFQAWFKTFFGKVLMVFIISLFINIFTIVLTIVSEILLNDNIIGFVKDGSWKYNIMAKFLLLAVVVGSTQGMLELIGWTAQLLSFDQKPHKYKNNFTQNKMGLFKRGEEGYNNYIKSKGSYKDSKMTNSKSIENK